MPWPERPGKSRQRSSVSVTRGTKRIGSPLFCANPDLSEDEIVRIYVKRWHIEVFFKICKSYLQFVTECHSLFYDALTAHAEIVFTRYLIIAIERRKCEDDRPYLGRNFLLHGWIGGYHLWRILADHNTCYDQQCMYHLSVDWRAAQVVHRDVCWSSFWLHPKFTGKSNISGIIIPSACLHYWVFKMRRPFLLWEVLAN